MKNRHRVASETKAGAGGGAGIRSNIAPKLMDRQSGGRVDCDGDADGRKKGGRVKEEEHMHGAKAKFRLDKPGRKRGGRVGADSAPLSSAGKGDHPHSADDQMGGPRGGEPGYKHGGHVKKKK